ncbi:MAG: hypothetical protein ACYDEB_08865 [Dehalococcoidia bacterium]
MIEAMNSDRSPLRWFRRLVALAVIWVAGVYLVYYRLVNGRFEDWSRSDKIAVLQVATTIAGVGLAVLAIGIAFDQLSRTGAKTRVVARLQSTPTILHYGETDHEVTLILENLRGGIASLLYCKIELDPPLAFGTSVPHGAKATTDERICRFTWPGTGLPPHIVHVDGAFQISCLETPRQDFNFAFMKVQVTTDEEIRTTAIPIYLELPEG